MSRTLEEFSTKELNGWVATVLNKDDGQIFSSKKKRDDMKKAFSENNVNGMRLSLCHTIDDVKNMINSWRNDNDYLYLKKTLWDAIEMQRKIDENENTVSGDGEGEAENEEDLMAQLIANTNAQRIDRPMSDTCSVFSNDDEKSGDNEAGTIKISIDPGNGHIETLRERFRPTDTVKYLIERACELMSQLKATDNKGRKLGFFFRGRVMPEGKTLREIGLKENFDYNPHIISYYRVEGGGPPSQSLLDLGHNSIKESRIWPSYKTKNKKIEMKYTDQKGNSKQSRASAYDESKHSENNGNNNNNKKKNNSASQGTDNNGNVYRSYNKKRKNEIKTFESEDNNSHEQKEYDWGDDSRKTIKNGLVLIVCISKYDGILWNDLQGPKQDMKNLIHLWKNKFKFKIITNKTNNNKEYPNEYYLTQSNFKNLLDMARVELRNEDKTPYDGLIVVYSGHGWRDCIVTSKGERIKIEKIKRHFSGKNIESFKDKPKLFIFDSCRDNPSDPCGASLPCLEKDDPRLKMSDIESRNGNIPTTYQFYHPLSYIFEIYGNTMGYSVDGSSKDGGSLILPLTQHLGQCVDSCNNNHNNKNKSNIFDTQSFQQLLGPIERKYHAKWKGNQVIQIISSMLGYELYLGVNCNNKSE